MWRPVRNAVPEVAVAPVRNMPIVTMSSAKNTPTPVRDPMLTMRNVSMPQAERILAQRTATLPAGTPVCDAWKIGFVQIDTWT